MGYIWGTLILAVIVAAGLAFVKYVLEPLGDKVRTRKR